MKPNTLGEILWMIEADSMRRFDAALAEHGVSEEKRNSMRQEDFSRWYQPWPDWVLNIGAEVFDVHFPSVSKQTFISILRNIHWLIFEVKIEGESAQPPPFNWPPNFENEFLRFIGHLLKHFDSPQTQISEVKIAQLSPEHRLEIEQSKAERSKNHDAFAKALFQLLQKKAYPFEKMAVITDAKRNTLDSMGRPREKSSTLIYMEILKNWPEIESQTGPKELCHFLTPLLGNKSGIANQERVKKIVQRMGIVFRPKLSIGNQGTS